MTVSRKRTQSGQGLMEFGLCTLVLIPLFAGAFTIGMSLVKAIQVSSVCRTANVLVVRQTVNMADPNNQKLVVRTALGLGMGAADGTPDPAGKGVVFLSTITRIGLNECSQVNDPSGNPYTAATCPNYGYYVYTNRIIIGNRSLINTP